MACHAALADYAGRGVGDVLDELRSVGLTFIYNTQLLPANLRIEGEPRASGGLELAREILAMHGLGVSQAAPGIYAVIVQPRSSQRSASQDLPSAPALASRELEEVVVQTSRYALAATNVGSQTFITQEQVKNMPLLADETLRAVQRLPGTATNGFSSLGSVRGGELNETAIVLDGLRLYEPFHLKNFLSPVSLLDSRIIEGIEFYSGGFPALYGDRMSGVIDASTVHPAQPRYYELGLSLFHASALGATQFGDGRGQALVSVRRSNIGELAQYAENDFGEPHYSDGFLRVDYRLSDATQVVLDMLASKDTIQARQSSGTQQANAEYRNMYIWGTLAHRWSERAASRVIASYTDLSNERRGEVDDPGARVGSVRDERAFDIIGLRLENAITTSAVEYRFGLEVRRLWGRYDYMSSLRTEADFPFPGSPAAERVRAIAPRPDGFESSAYWDARVKLGDHWSLYGGLRVDTQTYDGSDDGEQWSPRLGVLHDLTARTRLRASWGRFFQSQGINELQVEDGVDRFHPAQYADHAIVSVDHDFAGGFDLRAEAYRKDYRRVSPRFENLFDPLTLFPEAEFDRVMIDADRSRAQGVELTLRMRPRGSWSGWLGYSGSRVEDRVGVSWVARSSDQRYALNFGVVWASGPWMATLTNSYHSGWPTTPPQVVYDGNTPRLVVEQRNRDRFDSYNSLDFRVVRTFLLSRGALEVFIEVSNALDRSNPCCVEYKFGQGDNGTLTYARDSKSWLPRVPSVGVLWKYGSDRGGR